jgi:FkbM family methyltransferase
VRPVSRLKLLRDILQPERKTSIVDIGANPINGKPPYALLRRSGLCNLTGFEPDPKAFAALAAEQLPGQTFLPDAVGDGSPATLHLGPHTGLTSTLPLQPWVGRYLGPYWQKALSKTRQVTIPTRRLDDMDEIAAIDFLKIDIQGGEMAVFRNGRSKLAQTAMIQTEAALLPYYVGQASLGEMQAELALAGFVPYRLAAVNRHRLAFDADLGRGIRTERSQVLDLDVVFLQDPIHMDRIALETLKHMTILADAVLGARDLVLRCLTELLRRGTVTRDDVQPYLAELARVSGPGTDQA